MSRQSPAVMPADFVSVAINMSQEQAAKHYGLSIWQVIRMMREMTPEWREEYKQRRIARQPAIALANLEAARAALAQGKGTRRIIGTVKRAMPDGFYDFMLRNSADAGCKEWRTSKSTIKRWKAELTEAQRDNIANNAKARKTAHIKAMTAMRVANSPPPPPKPAKRPNRGFGFNKLPDLSTLKGGNAETAAQHLRRLRYIPVCRGETVNKALKGFWLVGNLPAMPEADMIALAVSKGCDFDSWRKLAA